MSWSWIRKKAANHKLKSAWVGVELERRLELNHFFYLAILCQVFVRIFDATLSRKFEYVGYYILWVENFIFLLRIVFCHIKLFNEKATFINTFNQLFEPQRYFTKHGCLSLNFTSCGLQWYIWLGFFKKNL